MMCIVRPLASWSSNFVVIDGLLEARSHAERAAILLRLSDEVMIAKSQQLQDACQEVGFEAGTDFISLRVALHCATRTMAGEVPEHMAEQLEYWRRGMVALAGVRS